MKKNIFICSMLFLFGHFTNAQTPDLLYQQFSKGYDSLDAKVIANLYTEEAEVLYLYQNSNPNSFKGRAAILASFEEFFGYMKAEGRTLQLTFKIIDRQEVGQTILDNGFYEMVIKIPKQPDFVDYGKISTVLEKNEGEWKFKTDASTTATKEEFEKAITYQKEKE